MDSRIREPKCIFECYVEYIRPKDGGDPEMKMLFPKDYQFDEDTKKNLPKFVFPTRENNNNTVEEHFTFCLTDLEGTFRFGFCRYPARGDVCSCFLSDLPWFKVFYRIIDKLADMYLDHQVELIEPFLTSLHKHPVPDLSTDTIMSIIPEGISTGQVYTFPLPNHKRLPEIPTDHNLTIFYPTLHHQVILCLFANMLFERRIIITSSSLTNLSAAVHGSLLLLFPLYWQHIFIPITPPHLIDYCTAPMPFLMGIHSSMMEQVRSMPINDAVILDIDQSELESPYYEDLLKIPPDISSQLKNAIKKSSSAYGDTATRAFLQANVALLGGYRSALKMREGDSEVTFDEEAFLKSRVHMEEFLENLLHFQHFQQFINGRINRLASNKERDLFDDEVIIYEEELKAGKWSSDHMKEAFKDMKESLIKHSTKVAKNTKSLMKDTKNAFRARTNEKIGPGDYYTSLQSSPGLIRSTKSLTLDGRQTRPREPPPVIPYEKHIAGLTRLHETLRAQEKRLSLIDTSTPSSGMLLSLSQHHQQSIEDESNSIDSKDSIEVVTGQLVDLGEITERMPTPVIIRPSMSDEGETDSASIISSSSGSSGSIPNNLHWEVLRNDNIESPAPPPIPPPRKKRNPTEAVRYVTDSNQTTFPQVPKGDVFELDSRSSPLDDFSSSIADALIDTSRRISDPGAANTLSNTGKDIYLTLKDTQFTNNASSSSLPVIHFSTDGMSTTNSTTTDLRHMPTIPEQNDPWKPISTTSPGDSNPFKPGGSNVRKPPLKPQPYSGSGFKFFEETFAANPGAILTPLKVSKVDTNPSKTSSDPLADIFGPNGLQGYASIKTKNQDS